MPVKRYDGTNWVVVAGDGAAGAPGATGPEGGTTTLTTKGDVLTRSSSALARLGVGSNDQVLTADSAEATGLKWATPAAGGMTELATGSLSGASVTISSISASYKNLQLVIRDWYPDTSDRQVAIQFNSDTGNNYFGYTISAQASGSISGPVQSTNPQIAIPAPAINTNQKNNAVYNIYDYANTNSNKNVFGIGSTVNSSSGYCLATTHYSWVGSAAINSITIKLNANNFSDGTYILYGVK